MPESTTKTIDDLPNEVLLCIFDNLNNCSLNKAIEVCERWRSIIKSSSKILQRMIISIETRYINGHNFHKVSPDFPYQKFMFEDINYYTWDKRYNIKEDLHKFASDHPTLEWAEVKFINAKFFKDIVGPFQNFTSLNLVWVPVIPPHDASPNLEISLPNLKILGAKGATNLFKLIKDHQIHTLKVIDEFNLKMSRNISLFLKTAKNIKQIKFMGFIPQLSEIAEYPFELEVLSVLLKGQLPTSSQSVFEFVQLQVKNLKEMKLVGFNTTDFVEFAINEMNLRKFEVDLSMNYFRVIQKLKPNTTIKRLMLQFTASRIDNMMKILDKCIGVEDMKIVSNTAINFNEWIPKAAAFLPHLQALEIDSELGENLPKMSFKNLKILKCGKVSSDEQAKCWLELVSKCPNVERLSVGGWNQIVKRTGEEFVKKMPKISGIQFMQVISELKSLEEIYIGGNYEITNEMIFTLATIDRLEKDSKLRRFKFCTTMTKDELSERVKVLGRTRIQCTILPATKEFSFFKSLKRRAPES